MTVLQIDPIEAARALAWVKPLSVLLVAAAVCANVWSVWEALVDLRWVYRRERDEAFHIRAWQSVRDELSLLVLQAVILWLRFWSTFWPEPGNIDFAARWVWDIAMMTAAQLLVAIVCILNARDRRRTVRLLMSDRESPNP